MKRAWVVLVALVFSMVFGPSVMAGTREASQADGPRRLGEALASGTADAETIASIVRWVLEEEPEKVAPGLASALHAAIDDTSGRTEDPRWSAAAHTAVDLFASLLNDAQAHRRRDAASLTRQLAPLLSAAAPALADALSEVDPAARSRLLRALRVVAPAAGDVVSPLARALGHREPAVRLGAATALGALGPAARAAVPELRSALEDSDTAVREAAARALKRIQEE
jgi:hypothetical protein